MPPTPTYDDVVAENASLRQQNTALQAQVEALRSDVAVLKRLIGRDSSNSSMPPSGDTPASRRKAAKDRKQRATPSQRKPGKQAGTDGNHLARTADPDVVVDHEPDWCQGCGSGLHDAADAGVVVRQVFDIPIPVPVVTEHRAHRRRCGCGATTTAPFPDGVTAPAVYGPRVRAAALYLMARQHVPFERCAEAVGDLFALNVSTGWLDGLYTEAAGRLDPFLVEVADRLRDAGVIGVDETSDRVGLGTCWFHVARTDLLTLLHASNTRGQTAVTDAGILPGYEGTIIHDRLAMYWNYTDAGHGLCNAHLLRNLADVGVVWNQTWATAMADLLRETKKLVDTARDQGRTQLTRAQTRDLNNRYRAIVADGHTTTIKPEHRERNPIERDAHNLVKAFDTYQTEILAFTTDFTIPFDNNGAERDLRMVKLHRKISGCFRSLHGAERLAAVRSYISTTQKHGHDTLDALTALFNGQPWIPPPTGT